MRDCVKPSGRFNVRSFFRTLTLVLIIILLFILWAKKFNIKKAYRFSMSDHNIGNYPFGTELEDIPLFAINLD
ncbi:MAG: hypothetical protein ACI4MA_08400 [Treponema sp.]